MRQIEACISPDEIFCIVIYHFKVNKMVSKKTEKIRFKDNMTSKSQKFEACYFECSNPERVKNYLAVSEITANLNKFDLS